MTSQIEIQKPDTKELKKMDLHVYIPQDRIRAVLNSNVLDEDAQKQEKFFVWQNQKQSLLKFYKDMKNNFYKTRYVANNSQYGRMKPKDNMGTIAMKRQLRNFLMDGLYYDIDMSNCHVSIMLSLLEKSDFPAEGYETWKNYHENRSQFIEEFKKTFPGDAKEFITSLLFGGNTSIAKENPYLSKLLIELQNITNYIKDHNEKFYHFVRRQNKDNLYGSFLSQYLQEHEYRIMETVFKYLYYEASEYITFKNKYVLSYEYDGFKILQENVPDLEDFLDTINNLIQDDYPYVRFVSKPMTEKYDIEVKEQEGDYLQYAGLTDENVVDIIEIQEGNNLLYHEEEGWFFFDGSRWNHSKGSICLKLKDRMKKIVMEWYNTHVPEGDAVFRDEFGKQLWKLEMNKTRNNVMAMCCARFATENIEFFNSKELLVGFENGVYDLEEDLFRPYRYDDYVTLSTGYDYVERDEEKINFLNKEVLRKIHPDPEDYDMVMMIRSTGLAGVCLQKFIVMHAGGRNGKGVEDGLQITAMGLDYADEGAPNVLTKSIPENGVSPAHASPGYKRFVVCPEPKDGAKLDNDTIKSLTGGNKIKARFCFSNRPTQPNHLTLVLETNPTPLLKSKASTAERERWIDIYFKSTFLEEITEDRPEEGLYACNTTFTHNSFKETYKMSFFHILLDYFRIYKENNYQLILSAETKRRSLEFILQCNIFHKPFEDNYRVSVQMKYRKDGGPKTPISTLLAGLKSYSLDQYYLTFDEKRSLTRENLLSYLKERNISVIVEKDIEYMLGYERRFDAVESETDDETDD